MLVKINPINPQERMINKVKACLSDGGIIAYPTDTYYGIGCDIMNKKAIEKIYLLKQRDKSRDIPTLLVSAKEPEEMESLARESGAEGFLCKPFDEETLVKMVSGYL